MLPLERQEKILEFLARDGSVVVKDLANYFSVSKDSIRNDLTLLESQNKLKKSYGGAILVRSNIHEKKAEERKTQHIEEKKIIVDKAFSQIYPNAHIYLDMSTANILLAQKIFDSQIPVTICTTMLEIITILSRASNVNLIAVGGILNETREGFVGALTNQQLNSFDFDMAFMGTVGADLHKNKIYTYEIEDGMTKSTAIKNSRKTYLLLETRKLQLNGDFVYGDFSSINTVIAEKNLDHVQIMLFDKYNVNVL